MSEKSLLTKVPMHSSPFNTKSMDAYLLLSKYIPMGYAIHACVRVCVHLENMLLTDLCAIHSEANKQIPVFIKSISCCSNHRNNNRKRRESYFNQWI